MNAERLSEHLTVSEFLATRHEDLAPELEQVWEASPEIRANAVRLAEEVFEPVRAVLKVPLIVTSGLRSPALNERVHGQVQSRHLFGLALDLLPGAGMDPMPALFCLMHAMRRGELPHVDQVIVEGRAGARWLHVQAAADGRPARQLALRSDDGKNFATVT